MQNKVKTLQKLADELLDLMATKAKVEASYDKDNEAFIVRPSNDDYTCEIEWEDDPVGGKQVEVYAYCTKK